MFETTTSTVREKAGARVVVLLLLGLAVLAGGAYALAHEMAGDKVPRGTTVSGVDIGGLPRERAAAVLDEGLTERAAAAAAPAGGGNEQSVTPAEAGYVGEDVAAAGHARRGDSG